jgi:hypothetical protein
MSYPSRTDPQTGEVFFPKRRNQRFANPANRRAFHNQEFLKRRDLRMRTHRILEKNYRIFHEHLGTMYTTQVSIEVLQAQGFDSEYLTRITVGDGRTRYFVYDLYYIAISKTTLQIFNPNASVSARRRTP